MHAMVNRPMKRPIVPASETAGTSNRHETTVRLPRIYRGSTNTNAYNTTCAPHHTHTPAVISHHVRAPGNCRRPNHNTMTAGMTPGVIAKSRRAIEELVDS